MIRWGRVRTQRELTADGIEKSLHIVADAFEKQLDNLYAADSLDITADIKVLETMMAGEGLTEIMIGKGDKNA
jgi:hypothetical protein